MTVKASNRAGCHVLTEAEARLAEKKLRKFSVIVDTVDIPKPEISYLTQGLRSISTSRRAVSDASLHPSFSPKSVVPIGFQIDMTTAQEDALAREIAILRRQLREGTQWPYPAGQLIAYLSALLKGKLIFTSMAKQP